jgi:hypothetical protein
MSNNSNTPILIQGRDNLYDPLFCNLINETNGFYTCQDCELTYGSNPDGTSIRTLSDSNSNGILDCQTRCQQDTACKAYSYSNLKCKTYANIPSSINTNVPGTSSGYLLDIPYDYNNIINDSSRAEEVKLRCANQYLNNVYNLNNLDLIQSNTLTLNDNGDTTHFTIDPQTLYNLYNNNGLNNKTQVQRVVNHASNPIQTQSDSIIDSYKKQYDNYNSKQNQISDINNNLKSGDINTNTMNYLNKINSQNSTLGNNYSNNLKNKQTYLNNYTEKIIDTIENFENNNHTKFFLFLLIIIFLLLFMVFLKKNK